MKRLFLSFCAILALLTLPTLAQAEPLLQLYIEGAEYDTATETWIVAPPGSSGGAPFRLWAIGNIGGPGGKGPIVDVRLSAAYESAAGSDIEITLTPATTGGFGGFGDPSTPTGTGTLIQTVTDGSSPILGDGKSLPSHGIFGPGVNWQEFSLGDFTLTDSPVGDFIGSFPTSLKPDKGQINAYEITVTGSAIHPTVVHFDLYNTIEASNHAKFAPFSHDADAEAIIVPEPSSLVLCLFGVMLFGCQKLRRKRRGPTH